MHLIRPLLFTLATSLTLPLAHADQKKHLRLLAEAGAPDVTVEKQLMVRHFGKGAELKKVAFLGVETAPVSDDLGAQLGLADDTGLVVRHVVPDSPAAGLLKPHDILLKLDDQLLIAPRQFAVLVRNHKAGDEVSVTYIRGGKEASAKVKLAEHEVPKRAIFGAAEGGEVDHLVLSGGGQMSGAELKRTLSLLERDHVGKASKTPHRIAITAPGFQSTTLNTSNSNMVFTDDQGALELTIKDGKRTLVAKNPKGDALFSGPVDTPEQRKALPENVRQRLEKIEGMQEFSFQVDGDTDSAAPKATARGISLPLPAEAEAASTQATEAF